MSPNPMCTIIVCSDFPSLMFPGGATPSSSDQLYHIPQNNAFPAKLVHQHNLARHQRPSKSLLLGDLLG